MGVERETETWPVVSPKVHLSRVTASLLMTAI